MATANVAPTKPSSAVATGTRDTQAIVRTAKSVAIASLAPDKHAKLYTPRDSIIATVAERTTFFTMISPCFDLEQVYIKK
ncbi:TPA: hypothetical protein DCZ32_04900 [Candidatus Uhrbacteria bacterium]|nr:hypothetical protein [Candidatus Uhrbacteria bacterium]